MVRWIFCSTGHVVNSVKSGYIDSKPLLYTHLVGNVPLHKIEELTIENKGTRIGRWDIRAQGSQS